MEYYERLYSDTGLGDAEEIIRKQYIDSANILNTTLHRAIKEFLKNEVMLGYSYNPETKIYTITTSIGTRRIFIEYREYSGEKIRVITDVQIIRK